MKKKIVIYFFIKIFKFKKLCCWYVICKCVLRVYMDNCDGVLVKRKKK